MADTQLWGAVLGTKEIRAFTRSIHARQDSSDLYGVELRITKNGELYFSEVFRDERKLHAKSMEMFAKLSSKGWQQLTEETQR
jgi:hypothetical protein